MSLSLKGLVGEFSHRSFRRPNKLHIDKTSKLLIGASSHSDECIPSILSHGAQTSNEAIFVCISLACTVCYREISSALGEYLLYMS